MKKATIKELEAILNENAEAITLLPDGTVKKNTPEEQQEIRKNKPPERTYVEDDLVIGSYSPQQAARGYLWEKLKGHLGYLGSNNGTALDILTWMKDQEKSHGL